MDRVCSEPTTGLGSLDPDVLDGLRERCRRSVPVAIRWLGARDDVDLAGWGPSDGDLTGTLGCGAPDHVFIHRSGDAMITQLLIDGAGPCVGRVDPRARPRSSLDGEFVPFLWQPEAGPNLGDGWRVLGTDPIPEHEDIDVAALVVGATVDDAGDVAAGIKPEPVPAFDPLREVAVMAYVEGCDSVTDVRWTRQARDALVVLDVGAAPVCELEEGHMVVVGLDRSTLPAARIRLEVRYTNRGDPPATDVLDQSRGYVVVCRRAQAACDRLVQDAEAALADELAHGWGLLSLEITICGWEAWFRSGSGIGADC